MNGFRLELVLGDILVPINIVIVINSLNRLSLLNNIYVKIGLSIYWLCLYNHDIYCIIALIFYGVGNKKDHSTSMILFWPRKIVLEGYLKAKDIAAF